MMARHSHRPAPPAPDRNGNDDGEQPRALTKQEFGRKLSDLLARHGWNQSELARRAGIGRDAVSTYVRGRSLPEPTTLAKIARVLSMPPEELLPNAMGNAMTREPEPELEIRASTGYPGKMWIRLNRAVTYEQALEIMKVLGVDEKPDDAPH